MIISARPYYYLSVLLVIFLYHPGSAYTAAFWPSMDPYPAIYSQENDVSDKSKPLHLKPYIIQFTVITADDPKWTYDNEAGLNTRLISLKANITDIIKGKPDVANGTDINVAIRQKETPDGVAVPDLGFWSSVDLQLSHSYILVSESTINNIQSIFDSAVDISDTQGSVSVKSDIAFILNLAQSPVPDQAASLAKYLKESETTHSRYMAKYCLEIASNRSTPANSDLYEVITTLKYHKYDEVTKVRLFSGMRIKVKRGVDVNDALCGSVAMIVMRNIGSITSETKPNAVQEDALMNGMPWLLSSAEGIKYIQDKMTKGEKESMARTIGKICESEHIKSDYRGQLREIVKIIEGGQ